MQIDYKIILLILQKKEDLIEQTKAFLKVSNTETSRRAGQVVDLLHNCLDGILRRIVRILHLL